MTGSHKAPRGTIAAPAPANRPPGGRRRKHTRSRTLLPLGLVALLLAGGGAYAAYEHFDEPPLPALPSARASAEFGQSEEELCSPFETAACTVEWAYSEEPVGDLLKQVPEAGSRSKTVELVYSSGPETVAMPIVAGLKENEVEEALWEAGLTLGASIQQASSSPEGTVVSASVEPAEAVANGTAVDVVVSNGKITVPNWKGKTREFIEADASKLGIRVTFKEKVANDTPPGIALSQSVSGKEVSSEQRVTVVISKVVSEEKAAVPSVVGKTEEEAISLLASAGFLKIKTVSEGVKPGKPAAVVRVVPGENAEVLISKEITIFVGVAKG